MGCLWRGSAILEIFYLFVAGSVALTCQPNLPTSAASPPFLESKLMVSGTVLDLVLHMRAGSKTRSNRGARYDTYANF